MAHSSHRLLIEAGIDNVEMKQIGSLVAIAFEEGRIFWRYRIHAYVIWKKDILGELFLFLLMSSATMRATVTSNYG